MEYQIVKDERYITYKKQFIKMLNILFKWESGNVDLPFNIEEILRLNGSIGYVPSKNIWVQGHFTGHKNELNEYDEYVGITLNTEHRSQTYKNHDEIIVCGNNFDFENDVPNINFYALMQTENDVSMYYQLVNSRNIPVLVANSDKVKKEIERAFSKIKAGQPVVVTTSLMDEIEVKDIIDHDAISKMECLTSLNDVLLKRQMNLFGATLDVKDKKAQVNNMELQAFDDFTTINYLINYEARLSFVEEMLDNGFDIKCIRNPIFGDEPDEEEIEKGEMKDEEVETETDIQTSEREPESNVDEQNND